MSIILHPRTEARLAAFDEQLPHAVLLAGEPGVGLSTLARHLAGRELADMIEPLDSKEAASHEAGTISVEAVRKLYEKTRAKHKTRQIFVIDDADRMSPGAQAAFLKLLEEPTENTHFILTSHSPQTLLPTIRSRTQVAMVEPISATQTKQLLDTIEGLDPKKRVQIEYLGAGRPAEILRLARDKAYFDLRAEIMTDTRQFLAGSTYEKLLVVHKYHQNRQKALQLIDSALTVSKRSIGAKPQESLVSQLDGLLDAREKIEANCNARLQLMAFVL